jgi:hypothetical protein
MTFITFIYKVGKNNKTYYGKYCMEYISDDHEGLDTEVKYVLLSGLNKYREQKNLPKLKTKIIIGILSFSSNNIIPLDSTINEIKCFDFYCDYKNNIYVNGRMI